MAGDHNETRRTELKREAEARLRDLCSHFAPEEFDKLVENIVETQLRGERRAATWGSRGSA